MWHPLIVPNRDSASPRLSCVALHAADPQYHGQRESKGTHRTQPDAGTRPAWSERTVSPSATFALRENGEGCHPTRVTGQMTPAYAKESTLSVPIKYTCAATRRTRLTSSSPDISFVVALLPAI